MLGSGNRGSCAEKSGNVRFAKREHVQKDLSSEAVETPDAKAAVDEERKEVTKKAHKRTVHFVTLMEIRQFQKYECSPVNVRKDNLKCGHKYEYILVECSK